MLDGGTQALVLEVDPEADPIAGNLCDERGRKRRFSGWTGLAAALEELIDRRPEGTPTDRRGEEST